MKVTVIPLTVPSSSLMVNRSKKAWVGCSLDPLPPLMIGTGEYLAAMSALSSEGCLRTMASDKSHLLGNSEKSMQVVSGNLVHRKQRVSQERIVALDVGDDGIWKREFSWWHRRNKIGSRRSVLRVGNGTGVLQRIDQSGSSSTVKRESRGSSGGDRRWSQLCLLGRRSSGQGRRMLNKECILSAQSLGNNKLTFQTDSLAVHVNSLNSTLELVRCEWRPLLFGILQRRSGSVNVNLNNRLVVSQIEDLDWVVVQLGNNVVKGQFVLGNSRNQQWKSVGNTSTWDGWLSNKLGKQGWDLANGETVNRLNSKIVLAGNAGDVDLTAVKRGQKQHRCKIGGFGVGDNWLPFWPHSEMGRSGSKLVLQEFFGANKQRRCQRRNVLNLGWVGFSGCNTEREVGVGGALGKFVSSGQSSGVDNKGARFGDWRDGGEGETSSKSSLGDSLNIRGSGLGLKSWDISRDRNQTRQLDGLVRSLRVDVGGLQADVSGNSLDQQLGTLDVGNQWNSVINGHSSGSVTFRNVRCWSSESVGRRQVDVQVNQVVCQMLGERVLGLLLVVFSISDLVLVVSETCNLTGGSHFNTQNWIGTRKSGKGELWNLHGTVVIWEFLTWVWGEWKVHDGLGGHLNHVSSNNLGVEWERSGSSHVTLDNLDLVVLGNELDVEWSCNIQCLTNLGSGLNNSADGLLVQVLWRNNQSGITRVDTGVLNVLGNNVHNKLTVLSNGIHFNLLGVFNILGQNDWVIWRNLNGLRQNWVSHLLGKLFGLLDRGQFLPGRLVNTNLVKHSGELVSVLGRIDHLWRSTQNLDVLSVQWQSNVVRSLTTHRNDDTRRLLELVDIQDSLEVNCLKVQSVGLVVIGRNSFWVVVDHDRLESLFSQRSDGSNCTPVELDRRSNSVDTRSQNHHTVIVELDVAGVCVVCNVQVVCVSRELSSDGINLFDKWNDAKLFSDSSNGNLVGVEELGNLSVFETKLLGLLQDRSWQLLLDTVRSDLVGILDQTFQFVQEPSVNVGELVDLVDGISLRHGVGNGEQTLVRRSLQLRIDINGHKSLCFAETDVVVVCRSDGLLNGLFESSTNAHDLTNRLHRGRKQSGNSGELLQIPSWDLDHTVVQRWLETSTCDLGNGVLDLVQWDVQTKLGSSVSKRVTSSLRSQSRRSGQSGIDLNNAVFLGMWVQSVLNVTLTNNTQMSNHIDSSSSQHVVIFVGKSLGRSNHNGITGVDTQWIKVLHVTDSDTVVESITNNLVFNFFPSLHGLLDQDLRRSSEGLLTELDQFLLVISETGSKTTQSVSRTDNDWEANFLDGCQSLFHGGSGLGFGTLLANFVHSSSEQFSIFGGDHGIDLGTKDLNTQRFEFVLQLDTNVQSGLTTKSAVDCIRALDSLGTGVIELTSLSNRQSTGTKNQHFLGVDAWMQRSVLLDVSVWELDSLELFGDLVVDNGLDKGVEQELGVSWTWCRFWVELNREERLLGVVNTFVRTVVGVDKQFFPSSTQSIDVDGVTVVLGGDVTSTGDGGYTKDWSLWVLEGSLQFLNNVLHDRRISRTIGDEQTVIFFFGEIVIPWNNLQGNSAVDETPDLVVLHTNINSNDLDDFSVWTKLGKVLRRIVHDRLLGRHLGNQVLGIRVDPLRNIEVGLPRTDLQALINAGSLLLQTKSTQSGTVLSQLLGQSSGIDTVDCRNSLRLEPLSQRRLGKIMRVLLGVMSNNQTSNMDLVGLKVFRKRLNHLIHQITVWNTVVTHQWIRDHQNLSLIRWISDGFRITHHTGLKNKLTSNSLLSTK
ncbi:hypothetical protein OGAPHI_003278 [Ogataea philodendri]|uniref:Uncharacterized protein n=1 Tax=Ogataea philodendri TaxID=1378263 RepID=A0A9P8T5Y3_9ASCO|nr:uncharacterized protein OGAPHI_003278 [Ogataea philodendri]KAH3666829.1 hypothetical protein OGAPHI_003278 [Ogataea philodendri]